jgi:hypothetical protein
MNIFSNLPLMNVGVVGLQDLRISVTLYISETYLLSVTQIPTQGRMFETRPRYEPLEIISRPVFQLKITVSRPRAAHPEAAPGL